MENIKMRIALLWGVVIGGFALHCIADLLPICWNADICVADTGAAPAGLLAFMMTVSYLIPVAGILCVLFGRGRISRSVNLCLAVLLLLFNLFHLSELFLEFNPVQLPLLPVVLIVSGFLCADSVRLFRERRV